jgi:putative tricarboxylic transport membrane protein
MLVPSCFGHNWSPDIFPYLVIWILNLLFQLELLFKFFAEMLDNQRAQSLVTQLKKLTFKTLLILLPGHYGHISFAHRARRIHCSLLHWCFFGVSYAFGAKNAQKNLLISLIFSFIVYFSFTRGLNVNLPSRLIENTLGSGLDFVGRALGDALSALKGVFGNE